MLPGSCAQPEIPILYLGRGLALKLIRSVVSDSLQPHGCSLPGSSVHGILQARILEWVAISFSRGSFPPRDQTSLSCLSCTEGEFFAPEPLGKPLFPRGLGSCRRTQRYCYVNFVRWNQDLALISALLFLDYPSLLSASPSFLD